MFTLFSFTVALGSFLLFYGEIMIAKMLLPWFGGSASVWMVSLVFFTANLFFGYLYAYTLARHIHKTTLLIHGVVSALVLCITVGQAYFWGSMLVPYDFCCNSLTADPSLTVLKALFLSIGAPYLVLASGSVLLMAWYAHINRSQNPHRLYAFSNAGSLSALLAFPFLFEPFFGLHLQETFLFVLFCAYIALLLTCIYLTHNNLPHTAYIHIQKTPPTSWGQRMRWVGYAAIGASLFLSTTHIITQSIAPTPFLWVIPLAIYLISFIVAFSTYRYSRTLLIYATIPAPLVLTFLLWKYALPLPLTLLLAAGSLFILLVYVHGTLYLTRPPDKALPSFYLSLAFGGACGTAITALLAPTIFHWYWEIPIALTIILVLVLREARYTPLGAQLQRAQFLLICFALVLFCIGGTVLHHLPNPDTLSTERNFYGTSVVTRTTTRDGDIGLAIINGKILHGFQFDDTALKQRPSTYYAEGSGADIAFSLAHYMHPHTRIGVIGLGAGALAGFCTPTDHLTFYEINPVVAMQAKTYFSFLHACNTTVVVDDGRLALTREVRGGKTQQYDLLVLDAFTDDAIPVSLLTKEAFELYDTALDTRGVLVVHISNMYIDLTQVVAAGVSHIGFSAVIVEGMPESRGSLPGVWVIATRDDTLLMKLRAPYAHMTIRPLTPTSTHTLWTDDKSSILSSLRFSQ